MPLQATTDNRVNTGKTRQELPPTEKGERRKKNGLAIVSQRRGSLSVRWAESWIPFGSTREGWKESFQNRRTYPETDWRRRPDIPRDIRRKDSSCRSGHKGPDDRSGWREARRVRCHRAWADRERPHPASFSGCR